MSAIAAHEPLLSLKTDIQQRVAPLLSRAAYTAAGAAHQRDQGDLRFAAEKPAPAEQQRGARGRSKNIGVTRGKRARARSEKI